MNHNISDFMRLGQAPPDYGGIVLAHQTGWTLSKLIAGLDTIWQGPTHPIDQVRCAGSTIGDRNILWLGLVATGKSTVGAPLTAQLGVPQIVLDKIRWRYYAEIGYEAGLAELFTFGKMENQ